MPTYVPKPDKRSVNAVRYDGENVADVGRALPPGHAFRRPLTAFLNGTTAVQPGDYVVVEGVGDSATVSVVTASDFESKYDLAP